MASTSTLAIERLPPFTSAEMYAASFQPPNVNSTKSSAVPKSAGTPDEGAAAAAGATAGAGAAKPDTTTSSMPNTSSADITFCVRDASRRPMMFTAVNAITTSAA
jgi:hypothetical protein